MNNHRTNQNSRFSAWFWHDQREWKKHLRMKSNQSNNHYSKLISIEHTGMNQVVWHFEDLEYLNTINIQYSEILSNVIEPGLQKLYPPELMDVRFGRSTFNHFNHFISTLHCQRTWWIIPFSFKCTITECNGL